MDEKLKQAVALGREHYEKRDYDKAEVYLSKVIEAGNRFADIHNMMGVIHHDRGRIEDARDAFKRALELNPNYTEAALNLAVTYNDLGQYELAQQVYRSAIHRDVRGVQELDPFARGKIANLHADLAHAYLDVDMPNEAVMEYRNAIRLCPHFADLRVKLAEVYRQMGDLVAARYELEEAVRTRPDYGPARVALGVLLLVSGQRSEALAVWEETLRRDPHNKAADMYIRMAENLTTKIPPSLTGPTGTPE
jgi:tetratricopeptide (TPR) repeat protein